MKTDDLIKIEHYRRFLRPDWRRLLPPDPERGLTCEQIEAQRHDFMLRDRAFETPLARRMRKEQEARDQEEQERLEAEHQAEFEQEALKIKAEIAALRVELMWAKLCRKYGYNPNQPRVPAGNGIESGRWGDSGPSAQDKPRVAQYSIGTLVGQSRIRGGGSMCFYKFSFGIIMAPGPTNFRCPTWVPAAGVSHGTLIANDN